MRPLELRDHEDSTPVVGLAAGKVDERPKFSAPQEDARIEIPTPQVVELA